MMLSLPVRRRHSGPDDGALWRQQEEHRMNVSLKALIGKLNPTCRSALEGAAGLCLTRTHYDVDLEHLCLKLSEAGDTDFQRILRHYEIEQARLERDLTRALDRLKTGNARTPALSPRIPRLISEAWSLASIEFGAAQIRSGICCWRCSPTRT